jgi:hypothetical protein
MPRSSRDFSAGDSCERRRPPSDNTATPAFAAAATMSFAVLLQLLQRADRDVDPAVSALA